MDDLYDNTYESNLVLIGGFSLGVGLLILYFAWENGPFHRSRLWEGYYLSISLFLILAAEYVWIWVNDRDHISQRVIFLVMVLAVWFIMDHAVKPGLAPLFFRPVKNARKVAKAKMPKPNPVSTSIALELDDEIQDCLEACQTRSMFAIFTSTYTIGPTLLFLVMVHEISYTHQELAKTLEEVLRVVSGVIFIFFMFMQIRRLILLRPKQNHLHEIVMDMLLRGDKDVIGHILATCNIPTLVIVGWRTTVDALVRQLLGDASLCTTSKAILVDALQRNARHYAHHQELIKHIILSCNGEDLTLLKNLIDGGGDFFNLYKLIYVDITKRTYRDEIIHHMVEEAKITRDVLGQRAGIKILSDIDDTLYSSGGHFPAGCDKRYPKHAVYPGCLQLFRVLDQTWAATVPSCNVVFLSARPHVYKAATEDKSYRLFQKLLKNGDLHTCPTLLPGRLSAGCQAILLSLLCFKTYSWKAVGQIKYQTFFNFQDLYREYDFIFFGDNGQGDQLAAETILAGQGRTSWQSVAWQVPKDRESNILAAVIQRVIPEEKALALASYGNGVAYQKGLLMHDSYVQAALALQRYDPTLITYEQLRSIALAAMEDFKRLKLTHPRWGLSLAGRSAEQALRNDMVQVNALLKERGVEPGLSELQEFEKNLEVGKETLKRPMGTLSALIGDFAALNHDRS